MSDSPLTFEFDETRSAYLALDTLHELGYRPDMADGAAKPTLHIHVERQDITSALEIAQAYGGRLIDTDEATVGDAGAETYTQAYDLDEGIRIPAHLVAEDLPNEDAAVASDAAQQAQGAPIDGTDAFSEGFDPSEETFDGFSAGIRL
jgi:hypothetical protein